MPPLFMALPTLTSLILPLEAPHADFFSSTYFLISITPLPSAPSPPPRLITHLRSLGGCTASWLLQAEADMHIIPWGLCATKRMERPHIAIGDKLVFKWADLFGRDLWIMDDQKPFSMD
ncbi:unnamed protein product [Closterium sp. NIES-64]|nr:unnamed protein product [Closterium sp. NIES-64]